MSNLVIVAIPEENDLVWKISSEKVPHLTLCFLGDVDAVKNLEQIVLFVEHAASTALQRFYLTVDRRGELGADSADVLFFKKNSHDYKMIHDFRAALLQDNNIKTAYDSSTQFDGSWQPHLTLGYPASPANSVPDDQNSSIYSVLFNRVAVWTEDFDGPEFLLDDWDEHWPMDVAMSDIGAEFALKHFGVKGMRWGQRKAVHPDIADVPPKTRKEASSDAEEFTRAKLYFGEGAGTRRKLIKAKVESKKKDPLYAKAFDHFVKQTDLAKRSDQARKQRKRADVKKSTKKTAKGVGNVLRGRSQYANTTAVVGVGAAGYLYNRYAKQGEDLSETEDSMTHTAELGAEFLSHYGVKGMRWGRRTAGGGSNTSNVGEAKREGIQKFLDPQGHKLGIDVAKTVAGSVVPLAAPLTWPAQVRLTRGAFRGAKAKAINRQEKKFAKKAMSPKNFVAIHNGAVDKINRDIATINQKYPNGVSKSRPAEQKKYNDEVLKAMQDGYRQSANAVGNKAKTQHLDVEFVNDGLDFKIHAREGAPTPQKVKHAAEDVADEEITIEITGKIKRDANGYIVGFVFDDLEEQSAAHTIDLGTEFLSHYGVKGMRWGTRRANLVTTQQHIDTGLLRRRTKVVAKGGEAAPAHSDAVKAATHKQIVKKSGTDALSTQELRELANRLQVEGQVKVLMSSKGKRFVAQELESTGRQAIKKGAKKAAKKGAKRAAKSAATVATTAALL